MITSGQKPALNSSWNLTTFTTSRLKTERMRIEKIVEIATVLSPLKIQFKIRGGISILSCISPFASSQHLKTQVQARR